MCHAILYVTSYNTKFSLKIGDGKPGKVFNKLIQLWSKTGVDIIKQIESWNKEIENTKNKVTPYKFK